MENELAPYSEFEAEVAGRFGLLPNFFRSGQTAPELIQQLWGFARAGYLDNPMPSVFKERLFVWLSRGLTAPIDTWPGSGSELAMFTLRISVADRSDEDPPKRENGTADARN